MTEKVECIKCGVFILPTTANRNDGLCVPCRQGYREQIEESKARNARDRELNKTCPFRALWRQLVEKVYEQPKGFEGLTNDEKLYFSVGMLDGEVYNGGLVQFFHNSSGDYYMYAEQGLATIQADNALKILRKAKYMLFGESEVPQDQEQRWTEMSKSGNEWKLDALDTEYYEDTDRIGTKLEKFAVETGLVKNA